MTDTTTPTLPFTPPTKARTWTVTMADGTTKTVTASACRIEAGAIIFGEAAGMTLALAPGIWWSVEVQQ